ncbi:DEAD/DEAH box helicase family protein [Billgrantia aerodenitrificans]|uniref:AAA family ATPase n=1 Tax=Billgrantia aerodenitrificans TaxID=2733483 RepID=A0ABS9AN22_9GAMM|nr:DEAD/DEAH box helicase family protein [Halomonas aerodenitrificans]MCE8023154.1 AAA family ATPase [Halomonas aerodenitrificans]
MLFSTDQREIIDAACSPLSAAQREQQTGHFISIPAVGGSGKSVIIIELARRLSDKNILFLCHGRNVAERAKGTLPQNVKVSTMTAMALQFLRKTHSAKVHNRKIRGSLTNDEIFSAASIGASHEDIFRARRILGRFYVSRNRFPELSNVPPSLRDGDNWVNNKKEVNAALDVARTIWFSQCSRELGSAPLTYPAALKLWTQSHTENHYVESVDRTERISPLEDHEIIVIEEAQDSSEAMLDFLVRQNKHAILLFGDPFQALNQGDSRIRHLSHPIHQQATIKEMPESWRFGPSIASVLNGLTAKAGYREPERIIGLGKSNIYPANKRYVWEAREQHYTFISYGWPTLFQCALEATQKGKTLGWVDGIESYPVALLRDLSALATSYDPKVHDVPPSQQINTFWLRQCSDLEMARELSVKRNNSLCVALCDWINSISEVDLLTYIDGWRETDRARQEALLEPWETPPQRDITLATVDRAKGNEFTRVAIADDFVPMRLLSGWKVAKKDWLIINAAYTAISRAQYEVAIPVELLDHFEDYGWTLRSNSFGDHDSVPPETKRHPHFGAHYQAVLEMTPSNRGKRHVAKVSGKRNPMYSNSQPSLRERVEQGAAEHAHLSVEEHLAMLPGRRRRRRK